MAVSLKSSDALALAIRDALGLPKHLRSLSLHFAPVTPVVIKAEFYPEEWPENAIDKVKVAVGQWALCSLSDSVVEQGVYPEAAESNSNGEKTK